MNGWGLFFLLLFLLVILPTGGWVAYTRWRAHQQGLPPPPWSAYIPFKSPRSSAFSGNYPAAPRSSGGPLGWVRGKWSALKSARAGSGYAGATRGQRGFGPLDPDAAWDDRVGAEADAGYGGAAYEEQELGLHPPASGPRDEGPYGLHSGGAYTGSKGVLPGYGEESRGRSRSREDLSYVGGSQGGLDERYEQVMHGDRGRSPYAEAEEDSGLRGVSPRPVEMDAASEPGKQGRKSMFREAM